MWRQAAVAALMIAAGAAVPARGRPIPLGRMAALPRPGVVLFWASWCAPCRAEVGRLPSLAEAARPLPVVVLALDRPNAAKAALSPALAGLQAFAETRPPARVLRAWGGPAAGLPLAVALNRAGRVCALRHGLLGTDQLREWAATCSQ